MLQNSHLLTPQQVMEFLHIVAEIEMVRVKKNPTLIKARTYILSL